MIANTQTIRFTPERIPMPKYIKIGMVTDNQVERLVFMLPLLDDGQLANLMVDGEYANMILLTHLEGDAYYVDLKAEMLGEAGRKTAYVSIHTESGEIWNSDTMCLITQHIPDVNQELLEHNASALDQMLEQMAQQNDNMVTKIQQMETIAESVGQNAMAVDMNTGLSKAYYKYAQDAESGAVQAYNDTIAYASEAADNAAKAAQHMQSALESEIAAGNHMIAAGDSATNAAMSQQNAQAAYESAVAAADRAQAAAWVDDTVAAYNRQWSSKTIVDRLCPEFKKSGSYVECHPVEGYPLDVTSKIEVVQAGSGDPSPDNVREIIGRDSIKLTNCGKNLLWFEDYEVTPGNGAYTDACRDGVFTRTIHKTHTTGSFILKDAISSLKTNYFPAGTYIFTISHYSAEATFNKNLISINMKLLDGTTVNIPEGKPTTIDQTGEIDAFFHRSGGDFLTGTTITFTIQLERSNAATEYEPYLGNTYAAELGQAVYGGRFNWTTGELTTEWEHRVLDGTEDWKEFRSAIPSRIYYYLILGAKNVYVNGNNGGVICSHWPQREILTTTENNGVHLHNSDTDGGQDRLIFRPDMSAYDTLGKWKAFLTAKYEAGHPVTVAYQRTEPMITQLVPQNIVAMSGTNNLFSNTGDTEVTGRSDPKEIISDMESRLAALEAAVVNNA